MSSKQTHTIQISGMNCTACAMNIDFEVEDLEGIHEVTTNYAKQVTVVTLDPEKVSVEKVVEVIKSLEYDAKVV